jgi:hypothetical protein
MTMELGSGETRPDGDDDGPVDGDGQAVVLAEAFRGPLEIRAPLPDDDHGDGRQT